MTDVTKIKSAAIPDLKEAELIEFSNHAEKEAKAILAKMSGNGHHFKLAVAMALMRKLSEELRS